MQGVDHVATLQREVKRVVGLGRVMRMARLRFLPADDFTDVFNEGLTLGNVLHGKHAVAMDAGAAGLGAATGSRWGFWGHV